MPDSLEKFKHRAGRTGRAGRKGDVTVFLSKECKIIREYRRLLRESNQVKMYVI
jgi:superfamily II DNA/RNA helicase